MAELPTLVLTALPLETPAMLRLAVITTNFPNRAQPYRGQSTYQTLRILGSRMKVQVFCPVAVYKSWLHPVHFIDVRPDSNYSLPGVPARNLEYNAVPGLSRPLNGFSCARVLLPHVREFAPDLILNYVLYPEGFASILVGRKLKVPVILGAIGSDVHRIPDQLTRWFTRRALRDASFVITVSEDLRRRAIDLGAAPQRIRTVRNGVDTSQFLVRDRTCARAALGLDSAAPLVLFVGWLAAHKGINELMEAVQRLLPAHPRLTLACVGDGVLRGHLQARILGAGLERHVLLPGPLYPDQVALWMAAADVVCLPSHGEGCPNVVLEALACGRPVVASAVGGIPELVNGNCGMLVPPRDPNRLSEALASVLAGDWDSQTISSQSRRDWDQVATETFDICDGAIRSHRLP